MPGKPFNHAFYMSNEPGKGAAPMFDGDKTGAMAQLEADYAHFGRPTDGQYPIWPVQCEHDYQNSMSLEAAWRKQRNGARVELNKNPGGHDPLPEIPQDPQ